MANKWCVSTSHPLVVQIAEKYNLSKKASRDILTAARRNNPSLWTEDIDLDYLENTDEFQKALGAYVKKQLDSDDALTKSPYTGVDVEEYKDELKEMGYDISEIDDNDLIEMYNSLPSEISRNKSNGAKIIKLLTVFGDAKRMNFIGNWIVQSFISKMSDVQRNPETRRVNSLNSHAKRTEYYADEDVKNYIIEEIKQELSDAADALEESGKNPELLKELDSVLDDGTDNFNTLLYLYGCTLFRVDGVSVSPEGVISVTDARDESEEDDEDEAINSGEGVVDGFSVNDQNKSVESKLVPDIKILLSTLKEKERDGSDTKDPYGYGLSEYISPNYAMNQILLLCQGCTTFDEMMHKLRGSKRALPWIDQFIDAVDNKIEDGSNTSSRKEQLQTMIYVSMRKLHTRFSQTFVSYRADGSRYYRYSDGNVGNLHESVMRSTFRRFMRKSGAAIFNNGVIDLSFLKGMKSIADLRNAINGKGGAASIALNERSSAKKKNETPTYKEAYRSLAKVESEVRALIKALGIDIDAKTYGIAVSNSHNTPKVDPSDPEKTYFDVRTQRVMKLINDLDNVIKAYQDWFAHDQNAPIVNPLSRAKNASSYEKFPDVRKAYDDLIRTLTEFTGESYEQSAWINSKSYYSLNNPTSIQLMVEMLTSEDPKKFKDYIAKKYEKDPLWFIKTPSESADEFPEFYSDWLNILCHQNRRNGSYLAYREMPSVEGKNYGDLNDLEYALAIQNSYFTPIPTGSQNVKLAWYRMLISSDKPRFSEIRFVKYNDKDYKDKIANGAMDFFAQEIKRSANVFQYAVRGKGVRIKDYDPKLTDDVKAVIAKVKDGKEITARDVVKNGRYIFRNTGVSFFNNKFINDAIELAATWDGNAKTDTEKEEKLDMAELGNYVVDMVFNSHMHKQERPAVDTEIMPVFRDVFHRYMQNVREKYSEHLDKSGLYAQRVEYYRNDDGTSGKRYHLKYLLGNMLAWNERYPGGYAEHIFSLTKDAEELMLKENTDVKLTDEKGNKTAAYYEMISYYRERVAYEELLDEFIYNNWYAKSNMAEMFDVDLAFYGNTTNFQKRNAQVVSSGTVIDPDAKIHGHKVSDGKYRSITLKTKKVISVDYNTIKQFLRDRAEQITDPLERARFEEGIEDTLDALSKINPTDGQAFTSLSSLRKRLVGQGEWSRSDDEATDRRGYYYDENGKKVNVYTDEAVYWRYKRHELTTEDYFHVFAQPQKPFVYAITSMPRQGRGTLTYPVQHKNSELALVFLSAFSEQDSPESILAGISRFMEETALNRDIKERNKNKKIEEQEYDVTVDGIDTVNFDSAVKIGENDQAIDVSGMTGQQAYESLMEAAYGKNWKTQKHSQRKYNPEFVTEYEVSEYKIQQQKREHFKDSEQPAGTQKKILAINNIKDETVCTLPDGSTITGKELKEKYFNLLKAKMQNEENRFRRAFGITLPRFFRLRKLSNTLKSLVASDTRFSVDERNSLSVEERNGDTRFRIPLDESGHQSALESMLLSKFRKAYYKEKTNGGIVVQATSWGHESNLHIRFYSKNPNDIENRNGILATFEEYSNEHNDIPAGKIKEAYDKYTKDNRAGYAYFECEIPMPNDVMSMLMDKKGRISSKYFNKDCTWNMDEIKKVVPESCFDVIAYRVPTEAKYSMMVGKVVRFAPEASGSACKFPLEITAFTGSDFDIDTDTIERRPYPGKKDGNIDNQLFDLQLAALRSDDAIGESFHNGDFSDLRDLSYYVTVLSESGYSLEEINQMSPGRIHELCNEIEDMDLMNPVTDLVLRTQNAESKDMIGIAAVGVTSHAFMSLYSDPNNPSSNTRVGFSNNEGFTVVNDKGNVPGKGNIKIIQDGAILDAVLDMDGRVIGTEISKYVGASADAAKDAALYRLNINKTTLPILLTMHRLGISSDVARLFISHPTVREVISSMRANPGSDIKDGMSSVIDKLLAENSNGKAILDDAREGEKRLVYSELLDAIKNPDEVSLHKKFEIIYILNSLYDKSEMIRNLDSFVRYNSSNAMKGTTYLDRFAERQKISRLQKNLGSNRPVIKLPDNIAVDYRYHPGEYGKLCTMFPYIAETIQGELDLAEDVIVDNMPTYGPVFFDVAKRLGIDDKPEQLKKLYSGWKSYILFMGPHRIADFSNPDVFQYYTRDFETHYSVLLDTIEEKEPDFYNAHIKNNSFIKSLGADTINGRDETWHALSSNKVGISGPALEEFKRDWADMLNYHQTRKLAIDIAIHFLARSASFARDTPVVNMPDAIKQAIPNYIDAYDNARNFPMSESDIRRFMTVFALNNTSDKKIAPLFYETANGKTRFVPKSEEESNVGEITFSQRRLTEDGLIEKDGTGVQRIKVPVIILKTTSLSEDGAIRNVPFIITDDRLESRGDAKNPVLVAKVMVSDPLGIENKMSEYTDAGLKNGDSLLWDNENMPQTEEEFNDYYLDEPELRDEISDTNYFGFRTGSFVESHPFGDIDINEDITRYLSLNPISQSNNSYLEGRTQLKRADKLAGILNLRVDGIHRSGGRSEPAYVFNITDKESGGRQHEKAKMMATLLGTLGFNYDDEPVVKTYTDFEHANAIEFAIPIVKVTSRDRKAILDSLKKFEHLVTPVIDSSTNELQFRIPLNKDDAAAARKMVDNASNAMTDILQMLNEVGISESDAVEANFILMETLYEQEQKQILSDIYDEHENRVSRLTGQDIENIEKQERDTGRHEVTLADLVELAIRQKKWQSVKDDVRNIFGETRSPLKGARASYEADVLTDSVIDDMSDEAYDEIFGILDDNADLSAMAQVKNVIVNTANWIIRGLPKESLTKMFDGIHVSEESANNIIEVIKNKIDELDLC